MQSQEKDPSEDNWANEGGNTAEYEFYLEQRARKQYEDALGVLHSQPKRYENVHSIANLAMSIDSISDSINKRSCEVSLAKIIARLEKSYRSPAIKQSLNTIVHYLRKDYIK